MTERVKPLRISDLKLRKQRGEKIAMLTAYDATMARILDRAGIDVLLVGDSLGMVIMGYDTTVPVTLDQVVHHAHAVSRGARRALVVADMPFMTFQTSPSDAVRNAARLLQEGGAAAVKIEGGRPILEAVHRLVEVGIPVMGHLGLTPQSVHQLSGFRRQGQSPFDRERLLEDALALEQAGVFAVVLESIPSELSKTVSTALAIPTLGIGAGPHCDGQVLVSYDVFGLFDDFVPPFVRQYARLGETMLEAAKHYISDVKEGRFPQAEEPVPRASPPETIHER